jgi:DNA-binding NarL/FixJ family response regulator
MARLFIVEDHPIFLTGLIGFLSESGHQIAGTASNFAEAMAKLPSLQADVAIFDVHLPDGNGVDLIEAVRDQGLTLLTILLSGQVSSEDSRRAMACGVNGMLLKDSSPAIVQKCIESVLLGHRWIEDKIMEMAMASDAVVARPLIEPANLTRAEKAIATQVVSGLRNREVAEILGLSEGTVKVHVHNIFKKLGVNSRTALAHKLRAA